MEHLVQQESSTYRRIKETHTFCKRQRGRPVVTSGKIEIYHILISELQCTDYGVQSFLGIILLIVDIIIVIPMEDIREIYVTLRHLIRNTVRIRHIHFIILVSFRIQISTVRHLFSKAGTCRCRHCKIIPCLIKAHQSISKQMLVEIHRLTVRSHRKTVSTGILFSSEVCIITFITQTSLNT